VRSLDHLFREATAVVDAGDREALEYLLRSHPRLVRERLEEPGSWLHDEVGDTLGGYFARPWLLWFVAGNPVRHQRLPRNIARLAAVIIQAARHERVASLKEQLDYTLGLVTTGRVPRESGVEIELIDTLIDAGATPGNGLGALGAYNLAAAQRLIERGGELTLAAALCLGRADDTARLAPGSTAPDRQVALAAAALNGNAQALQTLIALGVKLDAYSTGIHPHATALHHAVGAGSLDAVKILVEAGAALDIKDTLHHGTPLDWAEYGQREASDPGPAAKYAAIAAYLRKRQPGRKA
jgi:peptide-methionine (S)-S-oxide reductase